MAERRMISISVVDTDWFLELPLSTQALYFHLLVRADDDGFIASHKGIVRKVGANQNDLDLLVAKRFILKFDSGVIVIKHWKMHNWIRQERYKPTQFQEEFNQLQLKDNKAYTEKDNVVIQSVTPSVSQVSTIGKDRLGKDRLGKDRLELDNDILSDSDAESSKNIDSKLEIQAVFTIWSEAQNLIKHRELTSEMEKAIKKSLKTFKCEDIVNAIKHYDIILGSRWYFNYKWSMVDFLTRKNGLPEFMEEGSKWCSFKEELKKNPYSVEQPNQEKEEPPQFYKDFLNQI